MTCKVQKALTVACRLQCRLEVCGSTCDKALGSINGIENPKVLSICVSRLLHAFFFTENAVIWKSVCNFLSHSMLRLSVSLCDWTLVSFAVNGQRLSVAAQWGSVGT